MKLLVNREQRTDISIYFLSLPSVFPSLVPHIFTILNCIRSLIHFLLIYHYRSFLLRFSIMPRQSPARQTYTKTLGSLCKNELLQLAAEFGLPTDSSVLVLRDRVKTHLTSNNETLYRNPRYKALYPKVCQIPSRPRHLPSLCFSSSISTPAASPTLSYRNPSLACLYDSWHGI